MMQRGGRRSRVAMWAVIVGIALGGATAQAGGGRLWQASTPGSLAGGTLDGTALDDGLVTVVREAEGTAADVPGRLPGGTGLVCRDSSPSDGTPGSPRCDGNGMLVVKVFWHARLRMAGVTGRHTVVVGP